MARDTSCTGRVTGSNMVGKSAIDASEPPVYFASNCIGFNARDSHDFAARSKDWWTVIHCSPAGCGNFPPMRRGRPMTGCRLLSTRRRPRG
jgi:hypothetical protein